MKLNFYIEKQTLFKIQIITNYSHISMSNGEFNQKRQRVFPENTSDIIESLLEKYQLETIKGLFESFGPIKTLEQKKEFQKRWENLPGPCIAKILKEVNQGKIKGNKELINTLQTRLNIPQKVAQELTKDLQEKILNLLQTIPEIPSKKPISSKRPDIYREPIE